MRVTNSSMNTQQIAQVLWPFLRDAFDLLQAGQQAKALERLERATEALREILAERKQVKK